MIRDASERRVWAAVAEKRGLARRHPAISETANLIEENDEAALVVAEALLEERSAASGDVRGLLLRGIAGRPGSSYGRMLLGRSALVGESPALWARPLELAIAAAPGLDLASIELAGRYLAAWASLSPSDQQEAETALRRAFRNPGFVRENLVVVVQTLGAERAVSALPDDPASLRAGANVLRESGNAEALGLLDVRLKAARPAGASRPRS